jgi:hypothetical protein
MSISSSGLINEVYSLICNPPSVRQFGCEPISYFPLTYIIVR